MAAGTLRAQQPWITSSELSFRANTDDGVPTIALDERKIYRRMEGGGAAFTDGAAWLINQKLSAVQRDHVILRLFDSHARIGDSFLRNPIGSSDLTRGWYTYDDNSSDRADASLAHFSIDHDLADVLPLTKLARQLNPQLVLMINAWNPPAWTKSSGSLVAGAVLTEYYAHHANYHLKTIHAHEAHGLQVNYVSLNNEPTCCPRINDPSILLITSSQMATMLKDYWFPGGAQRPIRILTAGKMAQLTLPADSLVTLSWR
jgi:glucosylceramidase